MIIALRTRTLRHTYTRAFVQLQHVAYNVASHKIICTYVCSI